MAEAKDRAVFDKHGNVLFASRRERAIADYLEMVRRCGFPVEGDRIIGDRDDIRRTLHQHFGPYYRRILAEADAAPRRG